MWDIEVSNIAGIRSGAASLHTGVNVVRANNWQGKSSLLAAVQTVVGTTGLDGERHPITEGVSEGRVELETDSKTYVTGLDRESRGRVSRTGETYLTDETDRVCARLFAFLGEDNPIRAAVRNDDDLTELLQRPLDLENIDDEIESLREERRGVERELDRAERAAEKLPRVQEAITQLERDIDSLQERRNEIQTSPGESDERSELRESLSDTRADLDRIEADIQRIRNKIERREAKLASVRDELDDLEVPNDPHVDADIDEKRERIGVLETQIDLLEDLYSANKRVLDENQTDLVTSVERTIAGDSLTCWVCGETTSETDLTERLDALQEEIDSLRSEREELESEIAEIRHRQEEIEVKRRERTRLEQAIAEHERNLEADRQELANKRERRKNLAEEIEDLEARIEDAATEISAELADVESDLKIKRQELSDRREELETLTDRRERAEQLRERRDDLTEEIEALQERKRNKQYELKGQFDSAMEDVVETFDPGFETARLEPRTGPDGQVERYELVVARGGRQASLDALSEGEVELIGVVTALAGYKTFDVADRVPIFLLDGVGELADKHVHSLVEYLSDDPEMILTTAYPGAGDFDGNVLTPEEWDVVSREQSVST